MYAKADVSNQSHHHQFLKNRVMKANELQIGDYVNYRGQIIKVTSLYDKGGSNEVGWGKKEDTWVNASNVEPIPLTTEILEKNGFECKHKGEALKRLYWILNIEGGSVKVKINRGLFLFDIYGVPFQHGFYCPFVNKHIQYVHELQHAFKLCNIEKEIVL